MEHNLCFPAQDKLTCLGGHLWLYSIVAALTAGKGGSFKSLCGGLPPAIPLWSLKLACAYHDSCLGQACLHLAAVHAKSGEHIRASLCRSRNSTGPSWSSQDALTFTCSLDGAWSPSCVYLPAPQAAFCTRRSWDKMQHVAGRTETASPVFTCAARAEALAGAMAVYDIR